MRNIYDIPIELLLHILSYCDDVSICRFTFTSRYFHNIQKFITIHNHVAYKPSLEKSKFIFENMTVHTNTYTLKRSAKNIYYRNNYLTKIPEGTQMADFTKPCVIESLPKTLHTLSLNYIFPENCQLIYSNIVSLTIKKIDAECSLPTTCRYLSIENAVPVNVPQNIYDIALKQLKITYISDVQIEKLQNTIEDCQVFFISTACIRKIPTSTKVFHLYCNLKSPAVIDNVHTLYVKACIDETNYLNNNIKNLYIYKHPSVLSKIPKNLSFLRVFNVEISINIDYIPSIVEISCAGNIAIYIKLMKTHRYTITGNVWTFVKIKNEV